MAPMPTLNNGNSSNPASDSDRNTRDLAGERRNKRRAEDGPPAPTAVDVLLGGLEVNKGGDAQHHPSAPVAPVAPAAQVATAAGAAHATDAKHTPAPAAGPSRQRQRRRMAVSSSDATTAPALTQALTPDQVNVLLSLLQQQPVSVTAAESALPAASASGKRENAKGKKAHEEQGRIGVTTTQRQHRPLLQRLTMTPTTLKMKPAVADMAAMDQAASGYARVNRGGNSAPMPFLPKRGPPPTANCRGFRGSCFRCSQPGHVASACPRNGHGGQGPALVV
ncbi:unnamed protein product [Closterium sp. NIES-54]